MKGEFHLGRFFWQQYSQTHLQFRCKQYVFLPEVYVDIVLKHPSSPADIEDNMIEAQDSELIKHFFPEDSFHGQHQRFAFHSAFCKQQLLMRPAFAFQREQPSDGLFR